MNGFRLYREVNGSLVWIQDYGDLNSERWWRGDNLEVVYNEARYCERFYASYGITIRHWIAVYQGWTVEYVQPDDLPYMERP